MVLTLIGRQNQLNNPHNEALPEALPCWWVRKKIWDETSKLFSYNSL